MLDAQLEQAGLSGTEGDQRMSFGGAAHDIADVIRRVEQETRFLMRAAKTFSHDYRNNCQ